MYMARQLSFAGVTFDIKEVKLAGSFIEMYDAAVKLVGIIVVSLHNLNIELYLFSSNS